MRERKTISILGFDERPNQRQVTSGLASSLKGWRPRGVTEDPEWEPIPNYDELRNSSDVAFTHANKANIVKMFWHTRGKIGKDANQLGSLDRLVVLFNTGVIEVIDPDLNTGFETVATYSGVSNQVGAWDIDFTQMYDMGYICLSKGGVPVADILLEDDDLVENVFPELPVIKFFPDNAEKFTPEDAENNLHKGIISGSFLIRYAYRLKDGTLIKHTAPEIHTVMPTVIGGFSYSNYLGFYFEGFEQTAEPSNFEFWKRHIDGISVLCAPITDTGSSLDEASDALAELNFYELVQFDFIDITDIEDKDRIVSYKGQKDSIYSLETADIDDGTHHAVSHSVATTLNSRVIVAHEKEVFAFPRVSLKENLYQELIQPIEATRFFVYLNDANATVTVDQQSSGVPTVTQLSAYVYEVENNVGGSYNMTIHVSSPFGKNFNVIVTNESHLNYEFIPLSDYVSEAGDTTRTFAMEVELEGETGSIRRITPVTELQTVLINGSEEWFPHGNLLSYPDIRAKKINLYVNSGGTYYKFKSIPLKSSQKANFAFHLGTLDLSIPSGITGNPSADFTELHISEVIPNKVVASEVNNALAFNSNKVYRIGRTNEPITGFAVNAQEVSQGQFGFYPLLVFSTHSIWALEQSQSAEVDFGRISPIDTRNGVAKQDHITNIDQRVFFVNEHGVYFIDRAVPQKISDPVSSILDKVRGLNFLKRANDTELLVSLNNGLTYHFSLTYRRWYSSYLDLKFMLNKQGYSYGYSSADKLLDFNEPLDTETTTEIRLDYVHFGYPDVLKRFRFFYMRGDLNESIDPIKLRWKVIFGSKEFEVTSTKTIRPKWRSVYDASIVILANVIPSQHRIYRIESEIEIRYPRKLKSD